MKLFSMFIGLFFLAQSANAATPMGTYNQVNVTNPAALVTGIDEYSASPTGQNIPLV